MTLTTMLKFISLMTTILSGLAIVLVNQRAVRIRFIGSMLGLYGQIFWALYFSLSNQPGNNYLLITVIIFTLSWINGIRITGSEITKKL